MEKIRFQKNSDEMMRVISEQKKSLYLKAYVGSVYKDGVWRKMPEGQDPLQWFLTTSRTGNQMLYASAAVEVCDGLEDTWSNLDIQSATLQKMVNTPEQIKKNAALKNNGYKGKQTAGSGKSDRDLTDKMKDAAKNTAMILLGAVTVLVIAGFILFVILEIRLWLLEQTLKKQYEQADMD